MDLAKKIWYFFVRAASAAHNSHTFRKKTHVRNLRSLKTPLKNFRFANGWEERGEEVEEGNGWKDWGQGEGKGEEEPKLILSKGPQVWSGTTIRTPVRLSNPKHGRQP